MKKLYKLLLPVALSAAMLFSAISLTACNNEPSQEPAGTGTGSTTPTPEENPKPDQPETPENKIPTEKYDAFVASMAKNRNYTYSVTANGTATIYQIDGDKVCFYVVGENTQTILYTEGGYSYQLKYETSDGYYYKTDIDAYSTDEYILNDMKEAKFTLYDGNTKEYAVELDSAMYAMTVSDDAITFQNSAKILTVELFGKTTVPTIEESQIKDETSEKPEQPEKPPVGEEKIYTVNNGVRVYNSKLLGETLIAAMHSEYENGQTVFHKYTSNMGNEILDVLYVSTSGSVIEVGTIALYGTNKIIELFKIEKSSVESVGSSTDEWTALIKQQAINFVLGYELIGIDYEPSIEAEHQAVLKEVLKKALDKVVVDGVQVGGYNTKYEPKPRYANSQVLAVFEFKDGNDGHAGLDLGNTHRKGLVGIIKDADGQLMIVRMNIATTNLTTFEETVLNKENSINNKFVVYNMDKELELDEQFFQAE